MLLAGIEQELIIGRKLIENRRKKSIRYLINRCKKKRKAPKNTNNNKTTTHTIITMISHNPPTTKTNPKQVPQINQMTNKSHQKTTAKTHDRINIA